MRGPLLFLAVVVAVLTILEILRYWGWVPGFVQEPCHFGVVVGTVEENYVLLPLDYCQWMGQQ